MQLLLECGDHEQQPFMRYPLRISGGQSLAAVRLPMWLKALSRREKGSG
ncbi:hypothetical protein [Xanthomonas campestris]